MSRNKVIILFGPPGSGKSTQAALLSQKLDLIHFDTGKVMEREIYVTGRLKKYKKMFEDGKLLPSDLAAKIMIEKSEDAVKLGFGIVFSGSPRTVYEAGLLLPELSKLYGKKNIFIFAMEIPEKISIERNSARLVCSECGAPVLTEYYNGKPKNCPICGGKLYKRTVDKPAVIKKRLVEYRERTRPIFDYAEQKSFKLFEIDGKPAPYKVFKKINDNLKNA